METESDNFNVPEEKVESLENNVENVVDDKKKKGFFSRLFKR
jgi:hypothetical protein